MGEAMFTFIHAADVHLDSPLRGLERYDGAPVEQIRGATRQAFANLVELAIAEHVAFVLLAGDLYDGEWKDYNTGLFFAAQMTKLREAGVRAFLIAGNHDAASQLTRYLRLPDNVTIFSVQQPETVRLDAFNVALHGQGFSTRVVSDDLSAAYPEPEPHLVNIGLLHTSIDGREGHEPYAPCTREGLLLKGYDYWALGHVHKREVLHREPWIVFPGNIQGRHVRETGPKGCTLVTVQDDQVVAVHHRDLDVLRWAVCEVDVTGARTGDDAIDHVRPALERELAASSGRPMAVRVRLHGACNAHHALSTQHERWTNEIRTLATDISNGTLWIEQVKMQTSTQVDLDQMLGRDDALGDLLRALMEWQSDASFVAEVAHEFRDLSRKLPPELRSGEDALDFDNSQAIHRAVEDVKHLLLARLLTQEDGR
jgi:DNA repair exonuclease SbcCD nuclease subunit